MTPNIPEQSRDGLLDKLLDDFATASWAEGPKWIERAAELRAEIKSALSRPSLEPSDAALRAARAWIFECWGWLMETDLDMTCPMQTDPLDIVEQIDVLLGTDAALQHGEG